MGRYSAPFFCAFHALAVDDSGGGAGLSSDLFAALYIKRMMDILQRAVGGPKIEIIVSNAPSPGSTDAGDWPRTSKTSPAMPWHSCVSPRSDSCLENFVTNNQLSGPTHKVFGPIVPKCFTRNILVGSTERRKRVQFDELRLRQRISAPPICKSAPLPSPLNGTRYHSI